jgi:hypothetical protein
MVTMNLNAPLKQGGEDSKTKEGDVPEKKKSRRPFTMKFLHRNEEMAWESAQRSTMTNWTNYMLKPFLFLTPFFTILSNLGTEQGWRSQI